MNIVQLIMSQLGSGGMVDKIASMCGISTDQARTASGAAVPALLAGLMQASSTPEGARKLDVAVDATDDGNEAAPLSSRGASDGGSALQSLFGGGMFSSLAGAIGKFTGLGSGTITSLLGALGPMVLGTLKQQKRSLGLDAGGLAGLLASQKQNIVSAMPSGLSGMLGSIPGLSGLADSGRAAAADLSDRGRQVAEEAYDRGRAPVSAMGGTAREHKGSSAWWWAVPLVLLLAIIAGWALMRDRGEPDRTARTPAPAASPRTGDTGVATVPPDAGQARTASETVAPAAAAGDAVTQFTDVTKKLTDTLVQIKDPASADAAMPQLRDLSTKLDSINAMKSSLPADLQTRLTSMADTSRTTLKAAADKAMAVPAVGERIKSIVDEIMKKLDTLAGK